MTLRFSPAAALVSFSVLVPACVSPAFAQPDAPFPTEAQVREILRSAIDDDKRTVGIVAGWTSAEGTHIVAFGSAGEGVERPLDGDSIFEIGSITKTFTATMLSEMALRGELKLDDTVQQWLPENVKMPVRGANPIRLRDLATHMSGMPRMPDNMNPADVNNPYADYTAENLYAFLNSLTLARGVGEENEYSNVAYGLLGHVLERAAKTDYATLVQERIFKPLMMDSSAISLTPEMQPRLARGHNESLEPTSNWDLGVLSGAGAIRSTVRDMLAYARAQGGLDESPLSAAMQAAQKHDIVYGDQQFSLAWRQRSTLHGVEYIAHNGGTGGYRSMMAIDPIRKRAVVVLTNSSNGVDDIAMHILIPKYPVQRWKVGPAVATETLDRYVGVYEISPRAERTVTRYRNRLFVQRTGQPMRELLPRSDSEFFSREFGFTLAFPAEPGLASKMILTQSDGTPSPATRIEKSATNRMKEIDITAMDRIVGDYTFNESPEGQLSVWREGDKLLARLGSQVALEIFPESANAFFYPAIDAKLVFDLPTEGDDKIATGVTLLQNGAEQHAPRKR